ncbi:hypothetical protein P7K49_024621 [Saguinus oedipus]|uniref:Uncharacterized protein n=1 Tax=Saguinus oedipus TaxID=9490 RepID=A0ABQ9UQ11_SAGOE|nr:hypothetical protein P7K49_024621 [Saguinus oedipus]
MFSGLCRMASSNASLEGTGRPRPQETKGHRDPWVTVTREHKRSSSPKERQSLENTTADSHVWHRYECRPPVFSGPMNQKPVTDAVLYERLAANR